MANAGPQAPPTASVGRVPAPFIGDMIPPCMITVRLPGGTYFFTVNTYRRQTFLTDADVRSALRDAIGTLRLTHPFVIESWVLLPDHMHTLWTLPPGDEELSHRWRVVKRMVTQRCRTRLNRPEWMNARRANRNQSTLWQHRFWEHLIRMRPTLTDISITSIGTR